MWYKKILRFGVLMEKLTRYVGLFFALALLGFVFQPVPKSIRVAAQLEISKLDGTLLSLFLATRQGTTTAYVFRTARLFEECDVATPNISDRAKAICYARLPVYTQIPSIDSVSKLDSSFQAKYDNWIRVRGALTPTERDPATNLELLASQAEVGIVLAKYSVEKASEVKWWIYFCHFLVLLLGLFMIKKRQAVGGLVLLPFSLTYKLFRRGGSVAKNIHDRI